MKVSRANNLLSLLVLTLWLWSVAIQASPALQEGYVDLPGVRLHYIDSGGEGVPVIFLHAGTGSARVWENQIPAFTAAGYRFIAYDRRGWGESTINPDGPQPGNSADDLLGLADHLGLDRFHLIGFAAGGSVAWDAVLTYPERVRSVVIANNAGRLDEPDYRNFVSSLRPRQFGELPPEFRELSPAYRAANPEGTRRWLALELSSRSRDAQMQLQPLKNRLTFKLLAQVKTPVLLMAGGADLTAPAPLLHFFTEHVRHAETLIVPDAGHSIYWEQPEVFNKAVIDFISNH
jgi:pimeloyl-ACP methyl ester carboxylesterase